MKDVQLIKSLNDDVRDKNDLVRKTIKEMEFEFSSPPGKIMSSNNDDIVKLATQLKDEVVRLSPDAASERIAQDLEMLEYSPEEIEQLVPRILNMITNSVTT